MFSISKFSGMFSTSISRLLTFSSLGRSIQKHLGSNQKFFTFPQFPNSVKETDFETTIFSRNLLVVRLIPNWKMSTSFHTRRTFNFFQFDKMELISWNESVSIDPQLWMPWIFISPDNFIQFLILSNHGFETRTHIFWSVSKSKKLQIRIKISSGIKPISCRSFWRESNLVTLILFPKFQSPKCQTWFCKKAKFQDSTFSWSLQFTTVAQSTAAIKQSKILLSSSDFIF